MLEVTTTLPRVEESRPGWVVAFTHTTYGPVGERGTATVTLSPAPVMGSVWAPKWTVQPAVHGGATLTTMLLPATTVCDGTVQVTAPTEGSALNTMTASSYTERILLFQLPTYVCPEPVLAK